MVDVNLVPYDSEVDFPAKFAVVTCFFECDGQVLLLQRARKDSQYGLWGIPGGKLDDNEAPTEGLKREILEETGLNISENDLELLDRAYMGNSFDGSYLLYLYYTKVDSTFEATLRSEEHNDQKWVPVKDFLSQNLLFSQGKAFEHIENKLSLKVNESKAI